MLLLSLALVAGFDAGAAGEHARRLAALGPHPWGSPRARTAAAYVAAQLRGAGLTRVSVQEFRSKGAAGFNAVGVLPGPDPDAELVVVAAPHDSPPGADPAPADGAAAGVLIEAARALAAGGGTGRSVVFLAFDGSGADAIAGTPEAPGARAYVRNLGAAARRVTGALLLEPPCPGARATLVVPSAYPDPRRPGTPLVTPAAAVRAVLAGAAPAGAPVGVGDPWLGWPEQALLRLARGRRRAADLPFLEADIAAVRLTRGSVLGTCPGRATAETEAPLGLVELGRATVGAVERLRAAPAARRHERDWLAAFHIVLGRLSLLALGGAGLLAAGLGSAGTLRPGRIGHVLLAGVLLWRHPVATVFALLPAQLLTAGEAGRLRRTLAFAPLLVLVALAGWLWLRGEIAGWWLAPWEFAAAAFAVAALLLRRGGRPKSSSRRRRRA
jgi:hypothetical protein